MENLKRSITFHDNAGIKTSVKMGIEKGQFTISGTKSSGCGQIDFEPANKWQKELQQVWKQWHLNDLHAECEHQEKEDKDFKKLFDIYHDTPKDNDNIELRCERAEAITCSECGYVWGSSWTKRELPAGFEDTLNALCNNIEAAEKESAKEKPTIEDLMAENGIDEGMQEACEAYLEVMGCDDLDGFEEAYSGEFGSDEDFAEDFAEQIGAIDNDLKWPNNCIDWTQAASELMYDYCEQDGYYFRNY